MKTSTAKDAESATNPGFPKNTAPSADQRQDNHDKSEG